MTESAPDPPRPTIDKNAIPCKCTGGIECVWVSRKVIGYHCPGCRHQWPVAWFTIQEKKAAREAANAARKAERLAKKAQSSLM